MKEFIRANQPILVSFAVIAALFLTVAVAVLLFNQITPGMLLPV